jgi:hypothetical protein
MEEEKKLNVIQHHRPFLPQFMIQNLPDLHSPSAPLVLRNPNFEQVETVTVIYKYVGKDV